VKENKKWCPLTFNRNMEAPKYCVEKDCAFYLHNSDYESCSILSIAVSLHNISIDVAEISEKIDMDMYRYKP